MYNVMKTVCSAFLIISICGFASIASAGSSVYTIEGDIEAVFPSQPQFIGELQTGEIKSRTFQAVDVGNKLTYSLTLQTMNTKISEQNAPKELKQLAKGDSQIFSGKIVSYEPYNLQGYYGAKYEIHYNVDGVVFKKNTAVTYYANRFISWSITEISGLSTKSGKKVFNTYVQYFRFVNNGEILSQKKIMEKYISRLSIVLPKKINDKLDLVSVSSSGLVVLRKYVYWEKFNGIPNYKPKPLRLDKSMSRDEVIKRFNESLDDIIAAPGIKITGGTAQLKDACTKPTLKELLWSGLTLREEVYDIDKTLIYSIEFSSSQCPNKFQ